MSQSAAVSDRSAAPSQGARRSPRGTPDHAQAALVRSVRDGRRAVALTGPHGAGKARLLQRLSDHLGREFRCVQIRSAGLAAPEFCAAVLRRLGLPPTADPVAELGAWPHQLRDAGSDLLLLIEDADAMRLPTARCIGELAARSLGGLRLALAVTDGSRTGPVIFGLGLDVDVIRVSRRVDEVKRVAPRAPAAPAPPLRPRTPLRHTSAPRAAAAARRAEPQPVPLPEPLELETPDSSGDWRAWLSTAAVELRQRTRRGQRRSARDG